MQNKTEKIEVFRVTFNARSMKEQAQMILDKVNELHVEGRSKVGITYSADQKQTQIIGQCYASGKWHTGTSGANQAHVIANVETLLATNQYKHLQDVFRIVPITTMDYAKKGSVADDADVKASLDSATQFIKEGGYLLGWTNQLSEPGTVAIGGKGGVAERIQTTKQKEMIQSWVTKTFFEKLEKQPEVLDKPKHPLKTQTPSPKEKRSVPKQPASTPKNEMTVEVKGKPEKIDVEQDIKNLFLLLDEKIKDLEKRQSESTDPLETLKLLKAYKAVITLKINLTAAIQLLRNNPTENQYTDFQHSCNKYFETAHKELDKHRGWSEFLVNLAVGIATAGIGLVIKGAVNIANNRSFFFVHQTESSKVLDQTYQGLRKFML